MKNCHLNALVVLILAIDCCASSRTQQSNLFRSYDYGKGQKKPANPIRFQDDFKGRGVAETDSSDSEPVLFFKTFDGEKFFSKQNKRELYDKQNDETDSKSETTSKIKFEGNDDKVERDYGNDDQEESDGDSSQDSTNTEYYKESTSHRIKFEGNDDEYENKINSGLEKKTKSNYVVFEKQKARKKKAKSAREGRVHSVGHTAPMMSPCPELGYYGYSGSGYLGAGFPNTGDPKSIYTGYLARYPATSYLGYAQYPGSTYPPVSSGFMAYPTPGYQNPMVNPGPTKVGGGPSNIRHPGQEYSSGPISGPTQTVPNNPNSYQNSGYPGSYYLSYPTASVGYQPEYPGEPSSQYPVQDQRPYSPGYQTAYPSGLNGPHNRPSRRPKSLTQRAVSAVAEALTSIALYDDYQCVPRMLCEVAGGSTASSPALQKATAGLQPLLALLQSFDGVSTSPLLVFGRAAVLGVTSKKNPAACSKAYPQCPNDPEKLIYYLNNHNGGFFRFFGQPELSLQQHNLEQFYGYLSGQYGLLQPQGQPNKYPNPGYGLLPQNSYTNAPNYGANYRDAKDIKSEAEERIQNKPHVNALDDVSSFDADQGPKWAFPEDDTRRDKEHVFRKEPERTIRESNSLKFPENMPADEIRDIRKQIDYFRTQKMVFFPEGNNYRTNEENNDNLYLNNQRPIDVNSEDYVFDYNHNIFVQRPKAVSNSDVTTLYVVRGNGDPNHPEIVKVRPGQSV